MARSPRSTSTRSRAPKPTRASAGKPPRYVDIADRLEEEIRKLGPNSLLATEEQLAERFGVSRITVRGALDLLERSGLVSRLRGRGTVVSPRKIVRRFSPLYSFEKDLADQGIRFVTRLLSYDARVLPPPEIRDRLKLPRDGTVGCLSLLRLVDDRIVCHNFRYYPPRVAEKLQPHQIEVQDASEMLESIVGSTIVGVDWECEIAFVIGTRARYVEEKDALKHIAGYCICNDVSERHFQIERSGQWVKGKTCETFGPLGPWLVTTDEIKDPQNLKMWLDVNGKRQQDGTTANMIFGIMHLLHYCSQFMVLEPGDVVTTGTPPGVGSAMKPATYLVAGDVMELTIEGLGSQRQKVVPFQG